jgi:uncharacterized protein involved in outer membrane biogenesis
MAVKTGKRGWLFKLAVAALGLAALLVVAALVAPMFVNWDKLKDEAAAKVSASLGRKLSIGKASFSIFSGVTLNDISLANGAGFSKEPLFENASATVSYSLLSLLTGKVVLNSIEFDQPKILIQKAANGRFNFSDLGSAQAVAAPASAPAKPVKGKAKLAAAPAAAPAPAKAPAGLPELPVLVNKLLIKQGDFTYQDLGTGKTYAVQGMDLSIIGIDLSGAGRSRITLSLVADLEGKKVPLNADLSFRLDPSSASLDLSSAELDLPGLKAVASGQVKSITSAPEGSIKAQVDVDPDKIVSSDLPPSILAKLPAGLKAKGSLRLALSADGPFNDPLKLKVNGSLDLLALGVDYGSYPAVEGMQGSLKFSNSAISLDPLDFKLGGQPVHFTLNVSDFTVQNLMGPQAAWRAKVAYTLTSPQLVLDPLLGLAGSTSPAQDAQPAAAAGPSNAAGPVAAKPAPEPAPVQLGKLVPAGITVQGKVDVAALKAMQMQTGRLVQTLSLARQQAQVGLDLAAYQGTVQAKVNANLSVPGATYGLVMKVAGLKLDTLVDDYAASFPKKQSLQQIKGKVSGLLALDASGTGKGLNSQAIIRNLSLKGHFKLGPGKFSHLDIQEKLASVIPHPATAQALRGDITFDRCESDFTMKDGKAAWPNLVVSTGADNRGGTLYIQSNGWLKPGADIDCHVVPHFNPSLVRLDGALQDAFGDDKGWATYDSIAYYGPSSDKAKADFSQGVKKAATQLITKQVNKALQNKGQDLLKGLLGK